MGTFKAHMWSVAPPPQALEVKAKAYKSRALAAVFLMNNIHYMVSSSALHGQACGKLWQRCKRCVRKCNSLETVFAELQWQWQTLWHRLNRAMYDVPSTTVMWSFRLAAQWSYCCTQTIPTLILPLPDHFLHSFLSVHQACTQVTFGHAPLCRSRRLSNLMPWRCWARRGLRNTRYDLDVHRQPCSRAPQARRDAAHPLNAT